MREMDGLLQDMMARHEPSDTVLHSMRARINESIRLDASVDTREMISSIFREAFRYQCENAYLVAD